MIIKCIITDDEPFARKGLQGYVEKIGFLQLIGVCEDALQLNENLKEKQADLIFLDIEMPYITGIEFLRSLTTPPKIIFTTAYDKYAIQGFDLDVLDYLLKPISFDRFLKAANKAYEYFQVLQSVPASKDFIFVKADGKFEKIQIADILFVEALENYISIQTKERRIISHLTLISVKEKLPPDQFIAPHKSFLASIEKIKTIEGNTIHIDKFQIPISKYQKDEVMQKIVNNKLLKR
jgi:DNA-binding LytR/AlgR family response regulator